jgi:hypothetical protein
VILDGDDRPRIRRPLEHGRVHDGVHVDDVGPDALDQRPEVDGNPVPRLETRNDLGVRSVIWLIAGYRPYDRPDPCGYRRVVAHLP